MDDIRVSTAAMPGTALRWYLSAEHIASEWMRLRSIMDGAQGIDYETLSMALFDTSMAKGDYAIASESDEYNRIDRCMQDVARYAFKHLRDAERLLGHWTKHRLRHIKPVKTSADVRRIDALVEEHAVLHGLMKRGGR